MATVIGSAANISVSTNVPATNGTSGFAIPAVTAKQSPTINLVIGSSAGNVQKVAMIQGTVTSGTPYTFNVYSGDDVFGNVLNMAAVSRIVLVNQSVTSGQNLTLGGGTDPVMGSGCSIICGAGSATDQGTVAVSNPAEFTVVASTSDTITITAAAGTNVPFTLLILGR